MKRLLFLAFLVPMLTGCNGWKDDLNRLDDKYSKLYEELNNRLKAVESQVSYINTLLLDLQSRKYVTDMSQQGNLLVITYSNGSPTVIDLSSFKSEIGIALKDGIYCWTITSNGTTTFITDGQGNPIPCTGAVGATGQTGATGANGNDGHTPYIGYNGNWWINGTDTNLPPSITPQIINGYWWINGVNTGIQASGQSAYELAVQQGFTGTLNEWLNSLKATPPTFKFDDEGYWMVNYGNGWVYVLDGQGNKVSAKAESQPTTPVSVTEDADYVYITQANGEIISIPKFKSNVKFELEETSILVPFGTSTTLQANQTNCKDVFVMSKPEGWKVSINVNSNAVSSLRYSVTIKAPNVTAQDVDLGGNITFLFVSEYGTAFTTSIYVTTQQPPADGIYQVGDVYFSNGIPEGTVFYKDNYCIKIVSFDIASLPFTTYGSLQYSACIDDNDWYDGSNNTHVYQAVEGIGLSYFPAWEWCRSKGEGWYLPALYEFAYIIGYTYDSPPITIPTYLYWNSSIREVAVIWYEQSNVFSGVQYIGYVGEQLFLEPANVLAIKKIRF